jgi:hypothetical protein
MHPEILGNQNFSLELAAFLENGSNLKCFANKNAS